MNPFNVSKDTRGSYRRQNLGWKLDQAEFKAVTFWLGKSYPDACIRAAQLEKMWDAIQARWHGCAARQTGLPARWTSGLRGL